MGGAADRAGRTPPDPFHLFLWIAPLLYLAYALVTPVFETPDEPQHLFRAYQLSTGVLIGERRGNEAGGMLPAGLSIAVERELGTAEPHARKEVIRTALAERFGRSTPIDADQPPRFANFLGSVAYTPVGYGPQVIAILIGRALDLPVETILRLGRVFNAVLAYILLCCAFRALPAGRTVLLIVGLLPMTAACAGSFGQDGLLIGCSAWLVALCLRAVIGRRWTAGDGGAAVLLTIAITLAKFVYMPLAGIGLLLGNGSWRPRLARVPLIAFGLSAGLLVLWLLPNRGLAVPAAAGLPLPGDQLANLLAHPAAFPAALASTFTPLRSFILTMGLFRFGWTNVGPVVMAWLLTVLSLVVALAGGEAGATQMPRLWRWWTALICLGIVVLVALMMYLASTPLGADRIDGIQGRYLVPVLLPLFLAILPRQRIRSALLPAVIAALMLAANWLVLGAIAGAFYG